MNYNFVQSTLFFCIAGIFMPGFTAIGIFIIQLLLTTTGINCSVAWMVTWWIMAVGMVLLPLLFIRMLRRNPQQNQERLKTKHMFFNILEYTFLQAVLASFFTNSQTLCDRIDGQNGLVFALTGWMALPVLLALSSLFHTISKQAPILYEPK